MPTYETTRINGYVNLLRIAQILSPEQLSDPGTYHRFRKQAMLDGLTGQDAAHVAAKALRIERGRRKPPEEEVTP